MNAVEALAQPPAIYQTSRPTVPGAGDGPVVLIADGMIYALTGVKQGHLLKSEWAMGHAVEFTLVKTITLPEGCELSFAKVEIVERPKVDPSRN